MPPDRGSEAFEELRRADPPRVALDVEGDSFYRYGERLCLVQVAYSGAVRVHDPLADDLEPFFRALEARELVLHGADFDLRLLHAKYGFAPRRVFDTMLAARFLNLPKFGLSDLYEKYFGIVLEKNHQRADWCRRPLSDELPVDAPPIDEPPLVELELDDPHPATSTATAPAATKPASNARLPLVLPCISTPLFRTAGLRGPGTR